MAKHLWEVDHPYYCSESNYYSNECNIQYECWANFIADMGDADVDYNLLFRWDWKPLEDDDGNVSTDGTGTLSLFYMAQRKGQFFCHEVAVTADNEPAVIEFLKPRMAHLLRLWEPLRQPKEPDNA